MADTSPGGPGSPVGTPDPSTPDAGARRRRQSSTARFIVGCVLFVVGAEALTFGWQYVNVRFQLHFEQPVIGSQVGWLTWYFLINATSIVALWIGLQLLGFFPRDTWAPRAGTPTASDAATTTQAQAHDSDNLFTFRSDEHG